MNSIKPQSYKLCNKVNPSLVTRWKKSLAKAIVVCVALSASVPALAAANAEVRSSEYWQEAEPMTVDLGTGLALYNGSTGWAINVGMLRRLNNTSPLYAGFDFAFNFWNFATPAGTTSSSATGIQLLPTLVYGLGIPTLRGVYPYIGVSVGPHIYISKATAGAMSTSNANVFFQALIRPGARINLSRSFALNLEPKFGILRSEFIFLPQANIVVSL